MYNCVGSKVMISVGKLSFCRNDVILGSISMFFIHLWQICECVEKVFAFISRHLMSATINLNAISLFWTTKDEDVNDVSQNIYYNKGRGKFVQRQFLLFSPEIMRIPAFIQMKLFISSVRII